jgi:hypothetical protein
MKTQLKPSKIVAPIFVPYICALLYVIALVDIIVGVVFVVKANYINIIYCSLILLGIALLLFLANCLFSWFKTAEVRLSNEFIAYDVTNIVSVLGRNVTKHQIYSYDKYEKKGKNLVVYGNIETFEPLAKGKPVKKLTIYDYNDKTIDIFDKFKRKS